MCGGGGCTWCAGERVGAGMVGRGPGGGEITALCCNNNKEPIYKQNTLTRSSQSVYYSERALTNPAVYTGYMYIQCKLILV